MDNKIIYLIIGTIAMILIVAVRIMLIFENISIILSSALYFAALFLVPFLVGYMSKGNSLVNGVVLTISYVLTDYIVLSKYITLHEQFFSLISIFLIFVIITALTFIGAQIGKVWGKPTNQAD